MKDSGTVLLRARWIIPALIIGPLLTRAAAQNPAATKYVVLQVTASDGKVTHKAMAEKDQESFKKSQEEEFQKAKRSFQDEKKEFQKKHPGEKFEKAEPKKATCRVVKRDIKTYNEAQKIATDLDRDREKGKKNGNGNGNGKSGSGGSSKGEGGKSGPDK